MWTRLLKITKKLVCKLMSTPCDPYFGLDATKPVFGVSDKGTFKLVCSATETS